MIYLLTTIIMLYIILKVLHKKYPNSKNHQKLFQIKARKNENIYKNRR